MENVASVAPAARLVQFWQAIAHLAMKKKIYGYLALSAWPATNLTRSEIRRAAFAKSANFPV